MLGTIRANQGLWGHFVVLVRMVLSCSGCSVYCLNWMFDICSGASTACVPVLVGPVVSRPRATLWNKTKPLDHQLVLQKWIFLQIPLLLCKTLGFIDLAGWLWQSYHVTAGWGSLSYPCLKWCFSYPSMQLASDMLGISVYPVSSSSSRWWAESGGPAWEPGESCCKQQALGASWSL